MVKGRLKGPIRNFCTTFQFGPSFMTFPLNGTEISKLINAKQCSLYKNKNSRIIKRHFCPRFMSDSFLVLIFPTDALFSISINFIENFNLISKNINK